METTIRVLIADPSEEFRALLSDAIAGESDMLVTAAADGAEALRLCSEDAPNVLVTELVLPKLDGLTLLDTLRRADDAPATIVVSGFFNDRVAAACSELGAMYFLPKPCDTAALLGRIRQAAALQNQAAAPIELRTACRRPA